MEEIYKTDKHIPSLNHTLKRKYRKVQNEI